MREDSQACLHGCSGLMAAGPEHRDESAWAAHVDTLVCFILSLCDLVKRHEGSNTVNFFSEKRAQESAATSRKVFSLRQWFVGGLLYASFGQKNAPAGCIVAQWVFGIVVARDACENQASAVFHHSFCSLSRQKALLTCAKPVFCDGSSWHFQSQASTAQSFIRQLLDARLVSWCEF